MVVGVGVAVGVGVDGSVRTAVGVGVGLVEMTPVLAGVVVTGVATSEPPQAAMPARMRRVRRMTAERSITDSPRLVEGAEGQVSEGMGLGAVVDYRKVGLGGQR